MSKKIISTATVSSVDVATKEPTLYKSVEQLRGNILFTYTAALFAVMGFFTKKKNGEYPLWTGRSLSRFYGSPSVLSWHTSKGNFEKSGTMYRLTHQGAMKFLGRITSERGQSVDADLLPQFLRAIKTGRPTKAAGAKLGKMYKVK